MSSKPAVSRLELLARKRASERQQSNAVAVSAAAAAATNVESVSASSSSASPSASISSLNGNRGSSLLGKLRATRNGQAPQDREASSVPTDNNKKVSLAERLKQRKQPPASIPRPREETSVAKQGTSNVSLHSRLLALKSKKNNSESEQQPTATIPSETEPILPQQQPNPKLQEWQETLERFYTLKNSSKSRLQPTSPRNTDTQAFIVSLSKKKTNTQGQSSTNLKRNRKELFTVFYPGSKRNKINSNFLAPSPDDIVTQAQAKVFTEVSNNMSNLNLKNSNNNSDHNDNDTKPKFIDLKSPPKPRSPVNIIDHLQNSAPHLTVSVLGHTLSGKSTMIGRLLQDLNIIDINGIRSLKNLCERAKITDPFKYLTWITDKTDIERQQGFSNKINEINLDTITNGNNKGYYSISINPGDKRLIPQLIPQLFNTNVAIMVIDCSVDGFENGFNLTGQTMEHSILAKMCNISNIIIMLNKMDTIDWYQGRFDDIKNELQLFYKRIGFNDDQLTWIPCCSLSGEGITTLPASNVKWYTGPTLFQTLETLNRQFATRKIEYFEESDRLQSFSMAICNIVPSKGQISGWIHDGSIQPGESITVTPLSEHFIVDEIISINNNTHFNKIGVKNDYISINLLARDNKLLEKIEIGDFATSLLAPVHLLNTKIIKFKVIKSFIELGTGMKLTIYRQAYQNVIKIIKIKRKSKSQGTILECELMKDDSIPLFSDKQSNGNIFISRNESMNRTVGAYELLQ